MTTQPDYPPLYHLTDAFKKRNNTAHKCAKRLTAKGKLSPGGIEYTAVIVTNAIAGKSPNEQVQIELISMLAEVKGKSELVKKHLDAAEAILGL